MENKIKGAALYLQSRINMKLDLRMVAEHPTSWRRARETIMRAAESLEQEEIEQLREMLRSPTEEGYKNREKTSS